MENEIIINEEFIQEEVETVIERKLSPDEITEVGEVIMEKLSWVVQESVHEVIDFNEMMERNKNADKTRPHYKVYHRNENAFQLVFEQVGVFKNEKDARQFINHDIITEFDEWRVVLVDQNNIEREVYKINKSDFLNKNGRSE
jgi:hypothetical protein